MTRNNTNTNRRKLPRLLCSGGFSNTTLRVGSNEYTMTSINFNRQGIAIFSQDLLPEESQCQISFSHTESEKSWEMRNITCAFRHRLETDIGNQYGLQFITDTLSTQERQTLEAIEASLAASADEGDRYGLFN